MTVKIKIASLLENNIKTIDSLAEDFDGLKSEKDDDLIYNFERAQDEESFLSSIKRKLKEFELNFGTSVEPVSSANLSVLNTENDPDPDYSESPTVDEPIAQDVKTDSSDHINVYVESASAAGSYLGNLVEVDVVLNVSVSNTESYQTSNYKIVKRIAFDKSKLAEETKKLEPFQVVESEEGIAIKKALALEEAVVKQEAKVLSRTRRMAGLE